MSTAFPPLILLILISQSLGSYGIVLLVASMERLGRKGVAVYRSVTCEDIISVGNYLENKNEGDWDPLARDLREAVVEESITSRLRRIFRRVYRSEVSVFP